MSAEVCMCVNIIRPREKKEIPPFATTRNVEGWLESEDVMPSETGQTEKDDYYVVSLTCGI